jgi:cytochrome d ubiquinol oxidase subunit I
LFDDEVWLNEYFAHFGYGFFYDENPYIFRQNIARLVPNVPLNYWSFRIMIGLGFLFIVVLALAGWWAYKDKLDSDKNYFYRLALVCIPLVYVCTQAGWAVAEVGRQPWAIQDLMPTFAGVTSEMSVGAVQTTLLVFAVLLSALFVAALKIMFAQIKKGPKEG